MRNIIGVFALLLFLASCTKQEGVGGKNSITGVIIKEEYSALNDQFIKSYASPEERVYIIYGDDAYFADDTRTSYDGSFRFEYLYQGDYSVFVYSECLACPAGVEPLFVDVQLKERKQVLALDTIFVKKYIN